MVSWKMGSSESTLGVDVALLLLRCHQLEKELAGSAGLSVDEFHCLSQLYLHAPCCVKTLCELLEVHPTRASRLLNDLESKGYLTRTLGFADKRKELLTLTPAGVSAARDLVQATAFSVRQRVGDVPDNTIRLVADSLAHDESHVSQ